MHIVEYSDIISTVQDYKEALNNNPNNIDNNINNKIINQAQRDLIKKNIFPVKNIKEIKLNHYNPLKYKHSCPSTNEDENYHFGDLGNIIANNEGKAFISIIRKISLKSLNGRMIIITNSPDKCQENNEADSLADVIAFGQLNVFTPAVVEKANGSQEYFLREINAVNKEEFEKKNKMNNNKMNNDKNINNIKDVKNQKSKILDNKSEKKIIEDDLFSITSNKKESAVKVNKFEDIKKPADSNASEINKNNKDIVFGDYYKENNNINKKDSKNNFEDDNLKVNNKASLGNYYLKCVFNFKIKF